MDRILLVEDDRNTLEGLAEILSMENYEVVKAIDGKSAVRELKNSSFNVLLTDLVLPNFDGLELAIFAWKEQNEIMVIKKALEETKGNKTHAAKRLGFSIRTMRNKVNKYDL